MRVRDLVQRYNEDHAKTQEDIIDLQETAISRKAQRHGSGSESYGLVGAPGPDGVRQ